MIELKISKNNSLPRLPNYLITGGGGFIGRALIRYLLAKDLAGHIRVLDNLTVGTKKDLAEVCDFKESVLPSLLTPNSSPKKVELVKGDIRDPETCLHSCKDMDIVVHLAANTGVPKSVEDPRLDMESNVIGTFNMLEGARKEGIKRFVFASSGAPAGEVEPPIHEELPPHPVSPYGASKLAGEGYCSAYYRTFKLETVILRFGNVYGPYSGHKTSVVAKFIKQAFEGKPCEIYGDGTQTRDFIYIDDLIDAIYRASTLYSEFSTISPPKSSDSTSSFSIGGETFQIATSRERTVNELAELLKEILKKETGVDMKIIYGNPRLGDVKRNYSDTTKARKLLGWKAKVTLADGLKRTVQWFVI